MFKLLNSFFPEWVNENKFSDSKKFVIKDTFDKTYKYKNEIIKNNEWASFVDEIKFKNRFHSQKINYNTFELILNALTITLNEDEEYYRGRIWESEKAFSIEEMGAPVDNKKIRGGRVNFEGIKVLYLGDCETTVKYETRSHLNDRLTIGRFKLKKKITIIDFTKINQISPFYT